MIPPYMSFNPNQVQIRSESEREAILQNMSGEIIAILGVGVASRG